MEYMLRVLAQYDHAAYVRLVVGEGLEGVAWRVAPGIVQYARRVQELQLLEVL